MRELRILLSMLLAATFAAAPAFAQDDTFYFAPEFAYVLATDGDVDDTWFAGGKLGYQTSPNLAVELESGWMEMDISGDGVDSFDVEVIPVLANLRYSTGQSSSGDWYFYGGLGWAFNDLSGAGELDVDDGWIWQIGLGNEFEISDSLDAFIDVRYLANEPDLDEGGPVTSALLPQDANLQVVMFSVGLVF